jgi:hypothetical protein
MAAVALLTLGNVVRADTVTAELVNLIPFAGGTMVLDGNTLPSNYGVGELVWDGTIGGTYSGNPAPFNGTFDTFCIDLNETINFNAVYTFTTETNIANAPKVQAGGPMGTAKANEVGFLFGNYFGAAQSNNDLLQAFQLALWNIVFDTDSSVSNGAGLFYVPTGSSISSAVVADANTMLGNDTSGTKAGDLEALIGQEIDSTGTFAQDQIVVNPLIGTGGSVPLPKGSLMTAVLMAGYGIFRLSRSRRLAAI